jgi:cbb3-type cytochrome oxidase subunit 1
VRAHFWLAAIGVALCVLPLAIGGIVQANQLADPKIPFDQITKSSLMFLRVSTLGEVLLFLGHLFLLRNLVGLTAQFYRAKAEAAYAEVTADLFKTAEAKS